MGFELTVGLVPRQILDAAEVLWTSWTLEALARGCWGGLVFCRVLRWTFGRALGAAAAGFPRTSTAAATRCSLHLGLGWDGQGWTRLDTVDSAVWRMGRGHELLVVWTKSDLSPPNGHRGVVIGVL